jgi:4-amino-4-deoxy-L-arabinose transferase-like glycosyltransferase
MDRETSGQPPAERSLVEGENGLKALLLLALPLFLLFLGANAIWDANEAFYVETPRQMVLSGDYINPSFNALPRFNKPVLSYWIVAGLYKMFGISVTVERFGIAVGAFGILLAAFLIGRALRSTTTGTLAALIVATAPRVIMHSRRIFIDVYLTSFMSIALAGFVLALRFPEHRKRWLILMYVALGLGVLTKGPVAIALPVLACGIWLVVERRLRDLATLMLPTGAAIIAAIVLPWYVAVYAQHGWKYITDFIFGENLERFSTAMTPGGRDYSFYLPVLLTDLFPWAPLLILPLATAWKRQAPGEAATHASIRRLLWMWIVTIAVFFSFSQTKEDLYIFPTVAAAAALIADLLTSERGSSRATTAIVILVGATCIALGIGSVVYLNAGPYRLADSWTLLAILVATGAACLALWTVNRPRVAIAALAVGFIVFDYVFIGRVLPDVERFKPVPAIVRAFSARATSGARIESFNMSLPSLVFYLNRPVPEIGTFEDAAARLAAPDEEWLVTNEESWRALHERVPAACLSESHSLFVFDTAKISDIITGEPPPDALLVTNKCGGRGERP